MKSILLAAITGLLVLSACNQKQNASSESKKITIILQPFDDFPESYLKEVHKNLKTVYSSVKVAEKIPFPKGTWNHNKTRRRADASIAYLTNIAGKNQLVIGLTTKDISTSKDGKPDWGVFGLGYRPGKSCIASTFRLKGDKTGKLFKVAIHELGHTQGLPHCPEKNCFMRDAEGKDVLDEEHEFCDYCKTALIRHGWNLK
ncbi:matrixin family metalloprotease [Flavobacterium amniphilum]|uniref:matrixin family metalloprotease n=1 Tax=Flavobacterium amniphilum TaxID=1834035 RepID=UPI00202A79D3|nr:matrixin family metalloprotease [Flavobacterium amniphilum]MCL9807473.1 matrixin family metalloprotease [Flavobacterium amniphilum]